MQALILWYNSNKMIDFSSKKVQLALRFFTYGVMTVSTVILTILAIYYAMGYRLNQSGLVIEQGGIIEFRSEPSGADVAVDGKPTGRQTPGRAYVGPGEHTARMQLNGYRTWEKTVSLLPGQLLWLDYTRFIPQTITTTPVKEFAALAATLPSPDNRRILVQEQANIPGFTLADISNEKEPTFTPVVIPDATLTRVDAKIGTFSLVEWSHDSRYVLVRHTNGAVNEVLRLDVINAEATVNVTRQFGLGLSEVHFAGNNSGIVYALVVDQLRRLDVPANTVAEGSVLGVTQFSVYDDRVAFVANRAELGQAIGVYQDGKETIVASAPVGASVRVALTEYFRHQHLAYSLENKGFIVTDPASPTPAPSTEFNLDQPATWLQFSPKGRFVIAGNGQVFNGYDLEVGHAYGGVLAASRAPQWLDPFHIWTDQDNILRLREFDGQNVNDITGVIGGFSSVLSVNEKVIFSFNKSAAGTFTLQSSRIIN